MARPRRLFHGAFFGERQPVVASHGGGHSRGREGTLSRGIRLAVDYMADLPLWCDEGLVAWQWTKFSPELLDRLAAWQQELDENYHHQTGWRSAEAPEH